MLNVSHMLPHGNSGIGFVGDVIVAALLIGPPTVLMGSTIPVLTQALSRSIDERSDRVESVDKGVKPGSVVDAA